MNTEIADDKGKAALDSLKSSFSYDISSMNDINLITAILSVCLNDLKVASLQIDYNDVKMREEYKNVLNYLQLFFERIEKILMEKR